MAMTVSLSVAYRSTRRRITSSCCAVPSLIILLLLMVAVDSFHLISSEKIRMMKKKQQQTTVHSFPIRTIKTVGITTDNTILTALHKNKSSNTSSWRIETNLFGDKRGEGGGEELEEKDGIEENDEESPSSTAGESDLTDRFKYKVHALMGTYDTPAGVIDDENQTGRIIGAMLNFPTEYTFSVVGKTISPAISSTASSVQEEGEEEEDGHNSDYVNSVKQALYSVLGSDATLELRSVPRGTKFIRVSAKVTVESASIISLVYEKLGALDGTVMKF